MIRVEVKVEMLLLSVTVAEISLVSLFLLIRERF